ncbi:YhgE/Pip family protein [Haloimpatiens sp. FM7315]|uniref:YhgE/Pip family protein n=1 Tax=Haloimpatiens sp. FM7315 TaxID=3298609 RepID=UPI00370B968C
MNFLKIAGHDIKNILKNKFIMMAIVAIVIIPIVYSIFYLAAFWDPYGNTVKMPVAVVNLDKGGVNEGKSVNYGNDIVEKLEDNNKAKWSFVSYNKAEEGMKEKKYYAEFVIPEDFSKRILKVKEGKPDKGIIVYKSDSRKNYLGSVITDKISEKLEEEISSNIAKELTKTSFDKFYEIKGNLNKAADGSLKLHKGIVTFKDAVPELVNGVTKLEAGSDILTSKLSEAKDGSIMLNNGIKEASSKLSEKLDEFNSNKALKGVLQNINSDKINTMKSMLRASLKFKNQDLTMLDSAKAMMNKGNITSLKKTAFDFKALNAAELLKNPSLVALTKLNNEENIKNAQSLLKDVHEVQNIDMNKINALISGLKGADKLVALGGKAENLSKNISTNADKLVTLEQIIMDPDMDKYMESYMRLNSKYENLQKLLGGKNEITKEDLGKIDVNMLLKYINDMAKDAKDLQEVGSKIKAIGPSKVQESTSYVKNLVPQINGLKTELSNNKEAINSLHTALSPSNVNYIKGIAPKLLAMKSDLDKNTDNLKAMKLLLNNVANPKTKETINKITTLQKDVESIKPLIENIDKNINSKNMANLEKAPELIDELKSVQNKVKENEKTIALASEALNEGNIQKAQSLIASVPKLKAGVVQLEEGSMRLSTGLSKLEEGSRELNKGLYTMKEKMPAMEDGVDKLDDGSKELKDKLKDGADKLGKNLKNSSEDMGEYAKDPVETKNKSINIVPNYGSGFAPYFISLSLWVGAMMMFFIIENRVNEKFKEASSLSMVTGKFIVYGIVGILQALCVSGAVMKLGLTPKSVVGFFGFNIILSLVFISIMQCLIALLGDVGRFICMVFLILQLTSSAGTYPIELVPNFFKALYPFMPFTYSIEGLREIIAGSNLSIVFKDIFVLVAVALVFFIILVIFKKKGDKAQEFMENVKKDMM